MTSGPATSGLHSLTAASKTNNQREQAAVTERTAVLLRLWESQELARKSSQNLEAVTQATSVLAQGAQEISRDWLGFAQEGLKRNMDGLNALTRCRSVQDVVAVQSDLVRDNFQQVIDNSRRFSEGLGPGCPGRHAQLQLGAPEPSSLTFRALGAENGGLGLRAGPSFEAGDQ